MSEPHLVGDSGISIERLDARLRALQAIATVDSQAEEADREVVKQAEEELG